MQEYIEKYLLESTEILGMLDVSEIEKAIEILGDIKKSCGRLFIFGVGGSAANASHAVNDFRKIAEIETYTPTDNIAEITARTNDEGWDTTFVEWLKISRFTEKDIVLVFSVGGGGQNTSYNIVKSLEYARGKNGRIISVVSRNGGYAKEVSDVCIMIPIVSDERITPHAEEMQGIVWHLIVNALKGV